MKTGRLLLILLSILALTHCSIHSVDEPETNGYLHVPEDLHYAIVAFDTTGISVEELKDLVQSYNEKRNASEGTLRISNIYLRNASDDMQPLLVVRRFDGYEPAGRYAKTLRRHLRRVSPHIQSVLAISQDNYRNLLRRKDFETYLRYSEMALR